MNRTEKAVFGTLSAAVLISGCTAGDSLEHSTTIESSVIACEEDTLRNLAVIAFASEGFDSSKVVIIDGDRAVAGTTESNSFSSPLMSEKDYIHFINSGSQPAELVKSAVEEKTGTTSYNFSSNTVLVKIDAPTELTGNTEFDGSGLYLADNKVNPSDAFFVTVDSGVCADYEKSISDGSIVISTEQMEAWKNKFAVVRADCANPQVKWPVPATSSTAPIYTFGPEASIPTPPVQSQPPVLKPDVVPPSPPKPPEPLPSPIPPELSIKVPPKNVLVDPVVPPMNIGEGIPNNLPAQPPVDSGNGGLQVLPQPSPEYPPSGPGSGDKFPAPTEVPYPAEGAPDEKNPASGNPSGF